MKSGKIKIAVLTAWLLAAFVFIINCGAKNETSAAQTKQVKEIEGYKKWTKVNATPQLMPERVAAMCAAPMARNGVVIDGNTNPHRGKFFTVYVNEIGRKAMIEQQNPNFPEGSVIVKEKLSYRESPSPELLTVMIKHKKGFNPESGDWEYMVVDGAGEKIEERGKLQNCQTCHIANKETDYIFRTYLSEATRKQLK